MDIEEIRKNKPEGATHYRSLNWWHCGWYSLYQWKHVLWQTDNFGNAVVVNKGTLRLFNNIDSMVEVV